jgi:glucose-6-phosphate-specific signal transduction histidine kinase
MAISASVNNIELLGEIAKMNPNIGLGIYRIIEQLLLNSMLHGRAKHFTVSVSEEHENLLLVFTNDGELLSDENPESGHGFAIIDAWVTKFMGAWALSNQSDGVQVLIRFPRPISHL